MTDNLARPLLPEPGIYEFAGKLHGCRCLIAYDHEGEFTLRAIEPGTSGTAERAQLREWLLARGVVMPRAYPSLSLA